jgi:hypothetical protein
MRHVWAMANGKNAVGDARYLIATARQTPVPLQP